jgi:hemoglobin
VHDFVVAAAADPKVNFTRGGQFKLNGEDVAKLETRLVEFISSQTGGSIPYTGRSMRAAHVGMKITDEEFNAMAVDLAIILKKYSVPQQEIDELMSLIGGTRKDIVGQ